MFRNKHRIFSLTGTPFIRSATRVVRESDNINRSALGKHEV